MQIGRIQSGDSLVCCNCPHDRQITEQWIESVCNKYFPSRIPKQLYDTDLGRFICSSCHSKKLVRRANNSAVRVQKRSNAEAYGYQVLTAYLEQASAEEITVLRSWANQLLAIRDASISPLEKAKKAILITAASGAIRPFISFLGSEIKRIGWDERGLSARLALSAAASCALVFSGQGAGIAALGGAIGVPLWIVFGAGGAFAGVIIEEIKRQSNVKSD